MGRIAVTVAALALAEGATTLLARPDATATVAAQAPPPALAADGDVFAVFRPTIDLSAADRRQLARGEAVARTAPAAGREVAVVAAVPVDITPARLVAWMRRIELLKQHRFTLAIGRFSNPPQLEDLAALTLEAGDIEALRRCRPGDCGVKLPAGDLQALRREALKAGAGSETVNRAFRRAVLGRLQTYLDGGLDALPPLVDRREPSRPAERFAGLLSRTAFLSRHLPELAQALTGAPRPTDAAFERFVYWSKEVFGGKPVVAVTEVTIARHDDGIRPHLVVAGKGVLATHYVTASLGLTSLVTDGRTGRRLLVYINRSEIDVLDGLFGGVARRVLERRLRTDAVDVLRGLKTRLESGDPPATAPAEDRSARRW